MRNRSVVRSFEKERDRLHPGFTRSAGKVLGDNFTAAVQAAGARALEETLESGVAVFYRDAQTGAEVMEQPDGRKFEIRFIAGAPRDCNYEVLRELGSTIT